MKRFYLLVALTGIYAITYLLVGGLAYFFITKQFYVGDGAVFTTYLRSESIPEQWAHVTMWQFPLLAVRSVFIAAVLMPFVVTIRRWSFWKSAGVLFALLFVLTHLAAGAPSPGNLEGITYVKPNLISPQIFMLVQPEMIAQALLAALGFTWAIKRLK